MSKDQDLFDLTYDQQIHATGGNIEARDIAPNCRIPAEIVFERAGSRVRVTAYDTENHVLFQRDDRKTEENIVPRRVKGEVIFEPMGEGVRVTARDDNHKVLWGYVGSKETTTKIHCPVAMYDTLQKLVAKELETRGLLVPEPVDPMVVAQQSLDSLDETLKWLRAGLDVKDVSDATLERARTIARIASDANRQMTIEAGSLKGMKTKGEGKDIQ